MGKRICVFGDSIVSYKIGYPINWVTRLRNFINKNEEKYYIFNLGIVGDTTKGLLERIENECKVRVPTIIIVRIGVNDSKYNNKIKDSVETPITEFEDNIKKIIKICKNYANKIIFIGNIAVNESKTTPTIDIEYFKNKNIKKYDIVIKNICKKENVFFLNLFDKWIKIDYKKLLLKDGIHPNSEGHQKIFEDLKDFLIKNKII